MRPSRSRAGAACIQQDIIMKHQSVSQTPAALPATNRNRNSSLVKRLVQGQDDPAKQRIRALLGSISDEKLLNFGLSTADIALLRALNGNKVRRQRSC